MLQHIFTYIFFILFFKNSCTDEPKKNPNPAQNFLIEFRTRMSNPHPNQNPNRQLSIFEKDVEYQEAKLQTINLGEEDQPKEILIGVDWDPMLKATTLKSSWSRRTSLHGHTRT